MGREQRHAEYGGMGLALGGKIIETVSGEAIPQFYMRHLLGPLSCANTEVTDTAGGSRSVPLDMAKIAQMLLNNGAYGNMWFFSEKTAELRVPPAKAVQVAGGAVVEYGIGCFPPARSRASAKARGATARRVPRSCASTRRTSSLSW